MTRSRGAGFGISAGSGFEVGRAFVASRRLTHAVTVSLAVGSLSVCVIVALTVVTIKAAASPFLL